jgi:hypothetical protein
VCSASPEPTLARRFVAALASPAMRAQRIDAGFE